MSSATIAQWCRKIVVGENLKYIKPRFLNPGLLNFLKKSEISAKYGQFYYTELGLD